MRSETKSQLGFTQWNIDVDRFINPYILPSPARHLPIWLGRFVGYRREPSRPLGNVIVSVWSFIGTVTALSLIYIVNGKLAPFENQETPLILSSFVNESPFSRLFTAMSQYI